MPAEFNYFSTQNTAHHPKPNHFHAHSTTQMADKMHRKQSLDDSWLPTPAQTSREFNAHNDNLDPPVRYTSRPKDLATESNPAEHNEPSVFSPASSESDSIFYSPASVNGSSTHGSVVAHRGTEKSLGVENNFPAQMLNLPRQTSVTHTAPSSNFNSVRLPSVRERFTAHALRGDFNMPDTELPPVRHEMSYHASRNSFSSGHGYPKNSSYSPSMNQSSNSFQRTFHKPGRYYPNEKFNEEKRAKVMEDNHKATEFFMNQFYAENGHLNPVVAKDIYNELYNASKTWPGREGYSTNEWHSENSAVELARHHASQSDAGNYYRNKNQAASPSEFHTLNSFESPVANRSYSFVDRYGQDHFESNYDHGSDLHPYNTARATDRNNNFEFINIAQKYFSNGLHANDYDYSSRPQLRRMKPPHPYPYLIAEALITAPNSKLTLSGVYRSLAQRYPNHYQLDKKNPEASRSWRNTVRYNLSRSGIFRRLSDEEAGLNYNQRDPADVQHGPGRRQAYWEIIPEFAAEFKKNGLISLLDVGDARKSRRLFPEYNKSAAYGRLSHAEETSPTVSEADSIELKSLMHSTVEPAAMAISDWNEFSPNEIMNPDRKKIQNNPYFLRSSPGQKDNPRAVTDKKSFSNQ